jgi:uncharacterized protein (DUF427 family)
MTLTIGTGPFGDAPAGRFNFDPEPPKDVLYVEDSPRRVRVRLQGRTLADSTRMKLSHASGQTPTYWFPRDDVVDDLPEAARAALRTGDDPLLDGHVTFAWHAMDTWLEEDEEIGVHPRDPYHRVDVLHSSRHVRVLLAGELLAESRRPKAVFETGLPVRFYLPPADVRSDVFVPSDTVTHCPYKGTATYRSVRAAGEVHPDLVWTYLKPLREVAEVAEHFCFLNERVDLEVDGEPWQRPRTKFS